MRLIQIAGNANPNDDKESAKRLESRYASSIPSCAVSTTLVTERAHKTTNNTIKYIRV